MEPSIETSFSGETKENKEEKIEQEIEPPKENIQETLRQEFEQISNKANNQPNELSQFGKSLGLTPEVAMDVLDEQKYPSRLELLKVRMRKASEAVALTLALGTSGMAHASGTEAPRSLEPGSEATVLSVDGNSNVSNEQIALKKDVQEEVLKIMLTDEEAVGSVLPEKEIKTEPEQVTAAQEIQLTQEAENGELKAETFKEFSDERFKLYMGLVATIVEKGATSPEALKHLSDLVGKEIGENKGALADRVAVKVLPYYSGIKSVLEAMQGNEFRGKVLQGFDRLKHFAGGALDLAIDSSQLGTAGRLLRNLSRMAEAADTAEMAVDYVGLLTEIQKNPGDPKIIEKVMKLIEKKTFVEKTKGALVDHARAAYEATGKVLSEENDKKDKISLNYGSEYEQ